MANALSTTATGHSAHLHGDYLDDPPGLRSWLTTVDHKRIGLMYLWSVTFFMIVGGLFAMLIRLEHLTPGRTIMSAEQYNRVFTLHGAIMVFLVIIPAIPAALGNFALPLLLGAKDVAFPRINLMSLYLYWTGALMALGTLFMGGVDTGWTFYTPYSTTTGGGVTLMVLAAFVLGFSSIFTGVNFIATVHKLRAPGMGWFDMPLFCWGMYSTALIQILATPVLGITLLLLVMERVLHIGIFDPQLGGDPVLFQHFFWFYSHPAVYIMILPAMAVMSEVIPTFSHKTIFGYKAIAFSSVAIALARLPGLGASHVCRGNEHLRRCDFFVPDLLYRNSIGHQSIQLDRHHVAGLYRAAYADAICHRVPAAVHHRGADRSVPCLSGHRRPPTRHILRRRALPFRNGGLQSVRAAGRIALLVAEDVWPPVQRDPGEPRMCADFHRLQRNISSSVCSGKPRHAAPVFQLPPAVSGVARRLHHRQLDSGRGTVSRSGHSARITAPAEGNGRQPMGRQDA
jgi:hypothetical protein